MSEGGLTARSFDERLLDAAEHQIRAAGYEGLAPGEAARRAGVELNGDEPSRWELFAGVIRRDEDRFNAILAAAVAQAEAAPARLVALIEACVVEHDWTFWIELWSLALREERAKELREALDAAFRAEIEALVEEGRDSGEFEVADAGSAAVALATVIDALAVEATLGDTTVSPNFMLGASTSVAGRLVGAQLRLRTRDDDG